MIFNKSHKYDFPPEFAFQNGEIMECVEVTRLLGIYLSSDLRWKDNTREIFAKAMSKMWLLRRLKLVKLDWQFILDYYLKEIRPLVERGVVIWSSGLTRAQPND